MFRYHSHVGFQLSTSQGPIIVDQKEWVSPVEYDEDLVVMISEYWHVGLTLSLAGCRTNGQATDATMMAGILNSTQFKWILDPQAVAINGIAANACNASALPEGQECSTECGAYEQKVKPNTRYRVRFINSGVLSYYSLALEGHTMTLFEADVSLWSL
jgi:FtsP/CotA-like multicopper oxidase with cupredoxin domain